MNNAIHTGQKEHGQSLVELAVTVTILMVLLAGTIDLGRAFFTWITMRDAAQEGASYGTICPNELAELEARVRDNLDNNTYDVVISIPSTSPGNSVTVTVTTDLPITMPFLGTILGSQTITIRATIKDSILSTICPSP